MQLKNISTFVVAKLKFICGNLKEYEKKILKIELNQAMILLHI